MGFVANGDEDAPTPSELCVSYLSAFAAGDAHVIAAHVAEDFVNEHTSALGVGCVGRDEYILRLRAFIESLPRLRYDVEDVVADGQRVVATYTLRAVVNDRDVAVRGAMRFVVREGMISHRTDYWDSLVFQRQAGMT
jgi:ketosteroid isomerase-like protein